MVTGACAAANELPDRRRQVPQVVDPSVEVLRTKQSAPSAPDDSDGLLAGDWPRCEADIVRVAFDLGAASVGGPLSEAEHQLLAVAVSAGALPPAWNRDSVVDAIRDGGDPLGEAFLMVRSGDVRRRSGTIYTPPEIVSPIVEWTLQTEPGRIVDAGAGSGRFAGAAARHAPGVEIVAVDSDPLATMMVRATMAALGHRAITVSNLDYTRLSLPVAQGPTAFIGNPPYVRHHLLPPATKAWAQVAARAHGHTVSGLAGLHALFFLTTSHLARAGDSGCFVTSAEWLDVNYGAIVRELLLDQLGGESIHVVAPDAKPFEGIATTAAITCFRVGRKPQTMRFRSLPSTDQIGDLAKEGEPVAVARLAEARRWSSFVRTREKVPDGYVELGELCRVHRGAVTGSNATWVVHRGAVDLPSSVLFPSVTRARELFEAGPTLESSDRLRLVIDLPPDLDMLGEGADRAAVEKFLRRAKRAGIPKGYIAHNRRAWWSVGLREPAPILATYMARRPPAFVRNVISARHINIAHGLYPREHFSDEFLRRLVNALRTSITVAQGRTYAGGLTKFEPKEMERLPIPHPALLMS